MKLILSGGGVGEKTKEIDGKFASMLDKSKPLLYIPLAIDNIKHPYPGCLEWLQSTFNNLGVKHYEMWTENDMNKAKSSSPCNYAGVYIGGGNTPYLLNKLKNSGFWQFLKKAMKLDIPIYGGSAGAVIFSKTITSSLYDDKNWVEITDLSGMDVLNGCELAVHYVDQKKSQLIEFSVKCKCKVLALTERTGLEIYSAGVRVIGQEPAYLISGRKVKLIELGKFIL